MHAAALDHLRGVLPEREQGAMWNAEGVSGADWAGLQGPLRCEMWHHAAPAGKGSPGVAGKLRVIIAACPTRSKSN